MRKLSPASSGILLYIIAILLMSVMDLLAKTLSADLPVIEVVWARYAGQTAIVFLIVLPRIGQVVRTHYPGLQFLRSLFLLGATSMFFLGISQMGLAESTAIMDLNPVLITLGAALFLGERLGPRRMMGIGAALVGAFIIIRPGSTVFSPFALLPLGAAACYTGFALVTRHVGKGETVWTSLFYTALLGAAVLSVAVVPVWVTPTPRALALMALLGLVAAIGQFLMIRAFMLAEASTVAPFSYAGLLFATIWGAIFFDDFPDAVTLAGAAIIVGAGIYVWHRETSEARTRRAADVVSEL